jgi:hypothetical protein
VRSKYPQAWILCANETGNERNVINTIKAGGDTKVDWMDVGFPSGEGCDGHPDVAGQASMGQKLTTKLKQLLSW